MIKFCTPALLAAVKNYIDVTWEDADTDSKIERVIENGCLRIKSLAADAPDIDFESPGQAQSLLFEYCRLCRAGVPEKFEELFKPQLIGLRLGKITEE